MGFVVIYENAPMYKGLDEFAATAESVSGSNVNRSDQKRAFMTTAERAKAYVFLTEESADQYSRLYPVLDDAHKVARVVKCIERIKYTDEIPDIGQGRNLSEEERRMNQRWENLSRSCQ